MKDQAVRLQTPHSYHCLQLLHSSQAGPLSLLGSVTLSSGGPSAAGFAPPLSFDELAALSDSIPSASVSPRSLQIDKVNPQE